MNNPAHVRSLPMPAELHEEFLEAIRLKRTCKIIAHFKDGQIMDIVVERRRKVERLGVKQEAA